ncbi:MAG: DUF1566 domain-containing protein, partial [Spirochaetaceae bacterium]|nr:DUF1566 domain-containing protein [Spirochaetaceae bacterium]
YAGEVLPVTIIGKDFTAPGVTASGFTSTGATLNNVTIISDTKATAEVACPYAVGTTNVTVSYGESSATGTLKVVAAENCFTVGDILFTDGTRIKAEKLQYGIPDSQLDKAFAVIASAPYGGVVGKAVGLQKSSDYLQWVQKYTTGYNTNFTEIQGTETSGDIDGSDNWEYICSIDPEGTQDAATNYPVFNFALTYGTTAGLTGTEYETGWYVPSVAELYDVYTNKEVVQTSLNAAGGFTLGTSTYWSSSQYASEYGYAYYMSFSNGSVYNNSKSINRYVFVLQAFNVEQFNDYEILDITPPGDVSNVVAKYSASDNKISISWTNPTDEDFAGTILYYNNISNELKGERVDVSSLASSIVISGISADNTTYYITIQTRDTFGNIGTGKNIEVQAANNEPVSCDVETGDFVLSNNKYVKQNMLGRLTQAERDSIVGVVCVTDSGEPLILGLKFPETTLAWTTSQTGLNTYYPDISVTISELGNDGHDLGFTGDLDGSDNWEYIASLDTDGAASSAAVYPAFYYADMYPYVAGLAGTDFASDWYVPSAKELYDVMKNINIIYRSLVSVGVEGFPTVSSDKLESDFDTLDFYSGCTCLWTSSQSYDFDKSAFLVILGLFYGGEYSPILDFLVSDDNGEGKYAGIIKCSRDLSFHVWAFHKFDVNQISKYE